MYSTADWSITPRPMYPADGRKFFDIYAWPYSIREEIKQDLGEFPFAGVLGAGRGGEIAARRARRVVAVDRGVGPVDREQYSPTLSLVYLPHLDYNLQRLGPRHPGSHRTCAKLTISPAT